MNIDEQLLQVLKDLDDVKFNEFVNMVDSISEYEVLFLKFCEVLAEKRKELCDDDDFLGKACLYYLGKLHATIEIKGEDNET